MKAIINLKPKQSSIKQKLINITHKLLRSNAAMEPVFPIHGKNRMPITDVVGHRVHGKIGEVIMNKEHKNNFLNENFMSDLRRSLEALEIDESIHVVMLRAMNSEVFSKGTDLYNLYFSKKKGEFDRIDQYYEKLYNFQHFIANYHKPLMAIGNGIANGSGISMFANSPFPLTTPGMKCAFNETLFGYVPDGGSTFHLSRMEGEMGKFLALTGYEFIASDLVKLNLAVNLLEAEFPDIYIEAILNTKDKNFYQRLEIDHEDWDKAFSKYHEEKNKQNPNNAANFLNHDERKSLDYFKFNLPYNYPWERSHSDKMDPRYPTVYHSYVDEISEENKFSIRDFKKRSFTNTSKNFFEQIYSNFPVEKMKHFSLVHVVKDINRIFRHDNLQDIISALKEEQTGFSEYCLHQMGQRSPLAMAVTVRMLTKAKKMNYSEVIEMELNVAKNMVLHNPDFERIFDKKVLKKQEEFKFSKTVNEITDEDIDRMFQDEGILNRIQLDLKPNSLLPHRHFQFMFPDCFKLWINESRNANESVRDFYEKEIRDYLIQELGIDMRDSNLTVDEVRKVITKIITNNFINYENNNKFANLVSDVKFLNEYISKRENIIEFFSSPENKDKLAHKIKEKIKKNYDQAFTKSCEKIYAKCQEVRDLQKRKYWVRLKRWLFMNRIMQYKNKTRIIQSQRIDALGNKLMFIPEKLDVTYRDLPNPEVTKSAFHQLAGLFKIQKITPEYALRFASTDKKTSALFSYLEIDKQKLEEIKQNMRDNPEEFLTKWKSVIDVETDKDFEDLDDPTFIEYERVYRMRHEGLSTLDKLPFYDEYVKMRSNWKEIKSKMTQLLKNITLAVLDQIIKEENLFGKKIHELNKDKANLDSNKLEAIENLYSILYEKTNEETLDQSDKSKVNILKQNITNSILNDSLFKKLTENSDDQLKTQIHNLMQNTILSNLLEFAKEKGSGEQMSQESLYENLTKIFNGQEDSVSNSFISWIYINFGTKKLFSEILQNSKERNLSLVNTHVHNELWSNNKFLLSELKDDAMTKVKAIYTKEVDTVRNILKDYYQLKLNLLETELIERSNLTSDINVITIEYAIEKLRELSFANLIFDAQRPVLETLSLINEKIDDINKEYELIQLYINMKEISLNKSFNPSTITGGKLSPVEVFELLNNLIKKTEWFKKFSNQLKEKGLTLREQPNNLDLNISQYMRDKFTNLIYNNNSENESNVLVERESLNRIVNEKLNLSYINNLITKYRNDEVSLDENVYELGMFADRPVELERKYQVLELKNKISKRLKRLEEKFDMSNLRTKFVDLLYNSDHYIHRILCNVQSPQEIYTNDTTSQMKQGNNLFKLKSIYEDELDFTSKAKELKEKYLGHSSLPSSTYSANLAKTLVYNQAEYLKQMESLHEFLNDKTNYNRMIYLHFYDLLSFTGKYEVNSLLKKINCDSKKLYSWLKEQNDLSRANLNPEDFLISDKDFLTRFRDINFEEFITSSKDNYENNLLNHVNNKMKEIIQLQLNEMKENFSYPETENVQNMIRKLVTYEFIKGSKGIIPDENKIDSIMTELIEKERKIYDELVSRGKVRQETRANESNKHDYKKELNIYKHEFQGKDSSNPHETFFGIGNLNQLKSKVFTSITGLKHLKKIQSTEEESMTFNDYVKKHFNVGENPGLKYNNAFNILLGRKLSLNELITSDGQNVLSDYKDDYTFGHLNSEKIPVDLIKAALDVFDARLIKATKLILAREKNDLVNWTGMNEKTRPNPFEIPEGYVPHVLFELFAEEKELRELYGIQYIKYADKLSEEEKKNVQEELKILDENVKQHEEMATIDSRGHHVLVRYEKGSAFEGLLNSLNNSDPRERKQFIEDFMSKIHTVVPKPTFESKYSVLKYIYDYYMGTLQVSFENSKKEALIRMNNLNWAMFYNRVERVSKYEPIVTMKDEKNFLSTKTWDPYNPEHTREYVPLNNDISFRKDIAPINEVAPHIKKAGDLYDQDFYPVVGYVEKAKELAYNIFLSRTPDRWHWIESNNRRIFYSKIVRNELDNYFYISTYNTLKEKKILDKTLERSKNMTRILAEEQLRNLEHVEKVNQNLRKQEVNMYNENSVGFDITDLTQSSLSKDKKSVDTFLDDLFKDYFQTKKNSLTYNKERIKLEKENYTHMDNINCRLSPYDLLSKSQESYHEMKRVNLNKDRDRIKFDIDLYLRLNNVDKQYPEFDFTDVTDIAELDNAASQAIYGKYASIHHELVDMSEQEPNDFVLNGKHILDKNESEWVDDLIERYVTDFFSKRHQVERVLTREELEAVDQDLGELLSTDKLVDYLWKSLNQERLFISFYQEYFENIRNGTAHRSREDYKIENKQYEHNKNIKDETAYFQSLAFRGRIEKEMNDKIKDDLRRKRRTTGSKKVDKNITNPMMDEYGFEKTYMDHLNKQVANESRLEDFEKFSLRMKKREFSNLGKFEIKEPFSPLAKSNYLNNVISDVQLHPNKEKEYMQNDVRLILKTLNEKADKIREIDQMTKQKMKFNLI